MGQMYSFRSSFSLSELRAQLSEQVKQYNQNKIDTEYEDPVRFKETEQGFMLGLKRSGHSDGYWYCADVTPEGEGSLIRGQIVLLPRKRIERNERQTCGDWLKTGLTVLLAWPIIVFGLLWLFAIETQRRIRGLPPAMTKEKKLMDFMIHHMGCVQIDT